MAGTDGSSTSASAAAITAANAAQLRDAALAAAQRLEDEASAARAANDDRAAQLQQEAALLKSAAAAQDRVRAAADALSKERAEADALEAQAAEIRERLRLEAQRDTEEEEDERSVSSEATAITHLHNQACAVQNVKYLIPIVLDLKSPHYSKWRGYLLLALGRYSLKDHVLSDESRPTDPAWYRMDCVVVSWIFNSISTDLLDIIHAHDGVTARVAWLGIAEQFLGNRESRALLLDAEFRNLSQGELSVDDYCRKMKGMADALADLGEPVNDRTLVLNVLRGLNELFQFMAQLITRQKPFPLFTDVRADLRLAELNMVQPSAAPTAFLASSSSKQSSTAPAPSPAPQRTSTVPSSGGGPSGNNYGAGRGRRRRGGRNQGGQQGYSGGQQGHSGGQQGHSGSQQWPSLYNPWTGSIHMWPGTTPGGPRPPPARTDSPQQHAMMTGVQPPGYLPPPGTGSYSPALLPTPPA